MRTLRVLLFPALLIAAFLAVAVSEPLQSKEADHNQKGLQYYDQAFYQQLPKGKQREADESFDLAVVEFQAAISANPKSVAAHRNLARVYFVREDYLKAADAYRTVTMLEPQDINAYLLLALCCTKIDRFDEAAQTLETAKTRTNDPEVIGKLDAYLDKLK